VKEERKAVYIGGTVNATGDYITYQLTSFLLVLLLLPSLRSLHSAYKRSGDVVRTSISDKEARKRSRSLAVSLIGSVLFPSLCTLAVVMNVYSDQTRFDDDTDLSNPRQAVRSHRGIRSGVGLNVIRVSKLGAAR